MPAIIVMQSEALAWVGRLVCFLLDAAADLLPTLMGAFALYVLLLNVSPRFRRKVMLAKLLVKGGAKLAYALIQYKTSGTFPSPPRAQQETPRVPVVSTGKVMRRPLVKGFGGSVLVKDPVHVEEAEAAEPDLDVKTETDSSSLPPEPLLVPETTPADGTNVATSPREADFVELKNE
jgi:hypothetical protein